MTAKQRKTKTGSKKVSSKAASKPKTKTKARTKAKAKAKTKTTKKKAAVSAKRTAPAKKTKTATKAATKETAGKAGAGAKPATKSKPASETKTKTRTGAATKKARTKEPRSGSSAARRGRQRKSFRRRSALTPKQLAGFREHLRERRRELIQAYANAKGDSRTRQADGTEDYIDYAVSSYDREFLLSLTEFEQRQLMLVEEALRRLDRNEFGRCMHCGQEIPDKRLEVAPWARYCVRCQELDDQNLLEEPDLDDQDEDEEREAAAAGDDDDLEDDAEKENEVEYSQDLEPDEGESDDDDESLSL